MLTVLIADDTVVWLEMLEKRINAECEYKVIAKAEDGQKAIELIDTHRPDIIIVDIVMPKYDGVFIVKHIREKMMGYYPIIYVLSGIGTSTVIKELSELDIDFYSMKPVSMDRIVECLQSIITHRNPRTEHTETEEPSIDSATRKLVYSLGMPPQNIATKSVINALLLCLEMGDTSGQLTKVLYPKIAKERGTKSYVIEKNVRDSIACMKKNKTNDYCELFGHSENRRITNAEFLSIVAAHIQEQFKA